MRDSDMLDALDRLDDSFTADELPRSWLEALEDREA